MILTKFSFILRVRPKTGFHRHHTTEGLAKIRKLKSTHKCLPKSATGIQLLKQWKQLTQLPARCTSAPIHWQKGNSIPCPPAFQKRPIAFLLQLAKHKKFSLTYVRPKKHKSMNTQHSVRQYLIRYRDLQGKSHEDRVYAFNAMEAQNIAMEFNSGLNQRPHLISAILKATQIILTSFGLRFILNKDHYRKFQHSYLAVESNL